MAEAPTATAPTNKAAGPGPVTEAWRVLTGSEDILLNALASGSYQVIVLGRESEPFLSEAAVESLREWVSTESGALVCFRGQPTAQVGERLERLMPVQWNTVGESRFRMTLTDRGRDTAVVRRDRQRWRRGRHPAEPPDPRGLDPFRRNEAARDRPGDAAVDAAGNEKPVVTFQPYGGGRVVVVEGAGCGGGPSCPPPTPSTIRPTGLSGRASCTRWLVSGAAAPAEPGDGPPDRSGDVRDERDRLGDLFP